jgi:hypothetical protein
MIPNKSTTAVPAKPEPDIAKLFQQARHKPRDPAILGKVSHLFPGTPPPSTPARIDDSVLLFCFLLRLAFFLILG